MAVNVSNNLQLADTFLVVSYSRRSHAEPLAHRPTAGQPPCLYLDRQISSRHLEGIAMSRDLSQTCFTALRTLRLNVFIARGDSQRRAQYIVGGASSPEITFWLFASC